MINRNGKTLLRVLAGATLLAAEIVSGGTASAQEAIMLETIGAVRMAPPDEVRRMAAEQQSARRQVQEGSRGVQQDASAR